MGVEENKAVARRYCDEVISQHRLEVMDELVCEDFVEENPAAGQEQGREGLRRWFEQVFSGWPDGRWTVEEMIAEGDDVAIRAVVEGTHLGDFPGMPATGRHVRYEAWNVCRFRDGKIAATRFLGDDLSLLRQLGLIPDTVPL